MPCRIQTESGNVFFALFAAVGMVGILGASAITVIKGPIRTMQSVTKVTLAENNMLASAKLAVMGATNQTNGGDCDTDGFVEPVMYEDAGASLKPTGGGYLPAAIGAALNDPWQTRYGYCAWDHGTKTMDVTCQISGMNRRLAGGNVNNQYILAVISAGPDKVFQTSCNAWVDANTDNTPDMPLLGRVSGSDDIIYGYTYAEANVAGGGLWNLKSGQPTTAEIGTRDIEIKGSSGAEVARIGYDAGLGKSGVGDFLAVKTDSLYSKTSNGTIAIESPLRLKNITGLSAPMGGSSSGGGGDTLGSLSCSTNQIVKWNGSSWECANESGGSIPTGTIWAFDLTSCPSGWSEYTAARGRFLRGIDPSGSTAVDPAGTRTPGNQQADELKSHTHLTGQGGTGSTAAGATFLRTDVGDTRATSATGGAETRPKNVAVLFCRKN